MNGISDLTKHILLENKVVFYSGGYHSLQKLTRDSFLNLPHKNGIEFTIGGDPYYPEEGGGRSSFYSYGVIGYNAKDIWDLIPAFHEQLIIYDIERRSSVLPCALYTTENEPLCCLWTREEGLFRKFEDVYGKH